MTSASRDEPRRFIFIGLSVILAAVLVYFALSSIPAAVRPVVAPSTTPSSSSAPSQRP